MNRLLIRSIVMGIVICFAGVAQAGGTISSGQATFSILDSAPGAFKPTDFRPFGNAGGNYLFEDFWAYNPGFSGTSFITTVGESYAGDTATLTTSNGNATGSITYKISATPLLVTLTSTVTFTLNDTGNNSVVVYHYGDVDAGGSKANTAQLLSPGVMEISSGAAKIDFAGTSTSEYQAGAYSGLRSTVLSSPSSTLNNTGLPFAAGDFTGAYEWDLAMAKGVPASRTITYTVAVPEPAAAVFSIVAAVQLLLRRNRRTAA